MSRSLVKRRLAAGVIGWIVAGLGGCTLSPSSNLDATGILIVKPGEQVEARPDGDEQAAAFGDALQFAEANGADVGYPWIDPATGDIVLTAATSRGRTLLEDLGMTVPHQIRTEAHGTAELQSIIDGVTFLQGRGVPDANLIDESEPDHRDDRALIVISSMSRPLLDWLAAHYPPDALAVEVNPNGP